MSRRQQAKLNELAVAIESGDTNQVIAMIVAGDIDINARIGSGDSHRRALTIAATAGHTGIVELLLNNGAKLNQTDRWGRTACHLAAAHSHCAVVELLISRGADLMRRDDDDKRPIDFASDNQIHIALLKAVPLDDTFAMNAARSPQFAQVFLDRDFDFSTFAKYPPVNFSTPWHIAAHLGHHDALSVLLRARGVDIDATDMAGSTCCHIAVARGNTKMLRLLIEGGASVDETNQKGGTPLHVACECGEVKCARLLLSVGCDVNASDYDGLTAYQRAVSDKPRRSRLVHALLAAGADLAIDCAADDLASARRKIVAVQRDMIRPRAVEACIALQSVGLDALCMCEILRCACGPAAPFVPLHVLWNIATTIKHFKKGQMKRVSKSRQ